MAGAVAARCIGEMISPKTSKRAVEKFQILGLHPHHCDGSEAALTILRRMLLTSLPTLPHPNALATNKTERSLSIEVTMEQASRFYSILLQGRHLLPDGWIVAASDVPLPKRKSSSTTSRTSEAAPPPPPLASEKGESKRHLMLLGSCSAEMFHSASPLLTLLQESEDQTLVRFLFLLCGVLYSMDTAIVLIWRLFIHLFQHCTKVAMLNVFCSTAKVAQRGLTIQDTRVARAMARCGAVVLQTALDVLMQPNKSFIWRQRRAALNTLGK